MRYTFSNRPPNDECYTTEYTAEWVISNYFELLDGKKIIMPCDCELSKLYQVAKKHGLDVEIAQDMWGVDYSKYDLVFTNPPFSGETKWLDWLQSQNVKYLVFAPWGMFSGCVNHISRKRKSLGYIINRPHHDGSKLVKFDRPDGSTISVKWLLVTNLEEGRKWVEAKPDLRIDIGSEWVTYTGIFTDTTECNYLPYEYKGLRSDASKGHFVRRK